MIAYLLYGVLALIIGCAALYYIILTATRAANRDTLRQQRIIANLLAQELKPDQVAQALEQASWGENLAAQFRSGQITRAEYERKRDQSLS